MLTASLELSPNEGKMNEPIGLTALIERVGWWARRASEGHPYTIGNCEREAVGSLLTLAMNPAKCDMH